MVACALCSERVLKLKHAVKRVCLQFYSHTTLWNHADVIIQNGEDTVLVSLVRYVESSNHSKTLVVKRTHEQLRNARSDQQFVLETERQHVLVPHIVAAQYAKRVCNTSHTTKRRTTSCVCDTVFISFERRCMQQRLCDSSLFTYSAY